MTKIELISILPYIYKFDVKSKKFCGYLIFGFSEKPDLFEFIDNKLYISFMSGDFVLLFDNNRKELIFLKDMKPYECVKEIKEPLINFKFGVDYELRELENKNGS